MDVPDGPISRSHKELQAPVRISIDNGVIDETAAGLPVRVPLRPQGRGTNPELCTMPEIAIISVHEQLKAPVRATG